MHTLGVYHGYFPSSPRLEYAHNRSSSLGPTRPDPAVKPVPKMKSTNALAEMAASQAESSFTGSKSLNGSEESLSTIPDPRNPNSSELSRTGSGSSRHPDLSDEVAKLSDKLINAINHQTSLEDIIAQTQHELETSRARIQKLETEAKQHEDKLSSGLLIPKADADNQMAQLVADLANERKQKATILQEKRGIETELETLTASLFEEANKMVASANKERDAVERKNQQLRDQVKDTESLLANQQEQLIQLKIVMQQMGDEAGREEGSESAKGSTVPSSPSSCREHDAHVLRMLEAMNLSPRSIDTRSDISPAPSTTLTHLLKPVCRTDMPAFEDFRQFLLSSQKSQPASRVVSGSYAGVNVMGLGVLASSSSSHSQQPPNNPSTAVNTTSSQSATNTPQLPGSFSPGPNVDKGPIPLKEMKFYKRLLVEDIEPTLRLDLSPTISWLSRRSILSALTETGIIVEPIPEQGLRLYGHLTSCALCGEARKDDSNPRTHRMRVREGDGATKWALCGLCLEKVRATCDLVGYVRMVRDGVVRCADKEEEQEAWEELIRLRERLFWARMAGGVVPSFVEKISDKGSPVVVPSKESSPEEVFVAAKTTQSEEPVSTPPGDSSQDSEKENAEASAQLHRNLSDSIITSDPSASMRGIIRDVTPKTPPRFPPVREKRGGSWGNLKVNVPKAFSSLTEDVHIRH